MLIALSEALGTPVSTLLGETVAESEVDTIKALSEKLEIINLQFARKKALRRTVLHWSLIALCLVIVAVFAALMAVNSPYLGWDFRDPELAVAGTIYHTFEWLFVRVAPFILIAAIVGVCLTRKKA
ncbi:helix-turn-helix domain-containing protein [Candidatus Agathobaculum pullicola]|uniref:helix-turn-helix domain-containing protein n=1 Tax=Candidatus Agathobaculum pullicola TaxID=2838426 RepID=UPI003F8E1354